MAEDRQSVLPFISLATAGSLWGTGFFFGKIALVEMSVTTMVTYRFCFASLGLLPSLLHDRPRFQPPEWKWLLLASALGVPIQFLIQFKGLSLTTVSHAALMVGTLPMLLALAAVLFSGERLHVGGWIGLAASTLGASLIALTGKHAAGGSHPTMLGDLLVVLSMIAAIAWILMSKELMQQHSPAMVTAVLIWIGTAMLVIALVVTSGVPSFHYSSRAWIAVAIQGIFCTATTTMLWNWGLMRVPASRAGIFANIEPMMGAILGVFLLHESLGVPAIIGGALIVGGALYFSYKPVEML